MSRRSNPGAGTVVRSRLRLALTTALVLVVAPLSAAAPVAAANELLPDLKMSQLYNIQIQKGGSERRKLRFGTIVWNVGDGPLEVRASGRDGLVMNDVVQWIHERGSGGSAHAPDGATAFYSRDGHDHWHISSFIVIALYPSPDFAPIDASVYHQRGLRKIGFCLTDVVRAPSALRPPASEARLRYPVAGCGTLESQDIKVGISVGFGDDYKPFFNHQTIDITGLPAGVYRLCATVNSDSMWRERNEDHANNSSWADVELGEGGRRMTVVGIGESDCDRPAPVTYGMGA